MEGLIPFVYKAIMQYRNGKEGAIGTWICESPSYSYVRLSSGNDSGRFQTSASSALLLSDYGFSSAPPPVKSSSSPSINNNSSSSLTQFLVQSSGAQVSSSPLNRPQVSA